MIVLVDVLLVRFGVKNICTMCYFYNVWDKQGLFLGKQKLAQWEVLDLEVRGHAVQKVFAVNGFTFPLMPIVAQQQPNDLQLFQWGLVPFWVKDAKQADELRAMTLNAMCEGVFEKPSFRSSIRQKKCLIPALSFFEWRQIHSGLKIPYRVGVHDGQGGFKDFMFGGVYDTWTDKKTGEVRDTFSIITTPANEMMAVIHNMKKRMPLIIEEHHQAAWLQAESEKEIKELMVPYSSEKMIAHPISKLISSRKGDNNVPEVLDIADYEGIDTQAFMGKRQ